MVRTEREETKGYVLMVRNFYGVLHVRDDDDQEYSERVLLHGTINHGEEVLDPKLRYVPTSYYGPNSGVGRAIRAVQDRGPDSRGRDRAGRWRAVDLWTGGRLLSHL